MGSEWECKFLLISIKPFTLCPGKLFAVLQQWNFGPIFLRLLSTLYSNLMASITINGYKLDSITIQTGTRQGWPLSPLFVIAIERLATAIPQNPNILGVQCAGGKHKCALFFCYFWLLLSPLLIFYSFYKDSVRYLSSILTCVKRKPLMSRSDSNISSGFLSFHLTTSGPTLLGH